MRSLYLSKGGRSLKGLRNSEQNDLQGSPQADPCDSNCRVLKETQGNLIQPKQSTSRESEAFLPPRHTEGGAPAGTVLSRPMRVFDLAEEPHCRPHRPSVPWCTQPGPGWRSDQRSHGLRPSEHPGLYSPASVHLGGPGTGVDPLGPAQVMPPAHSPHGKMATSQAFQMSLQDPWACWSQ